MRKYLFLLPAAANLFSNSSPAVEKSSSPSSRVLFPIDPKLRSGDLLQAFDLLHKDKPTLKILLSTHTGPIYSGVSELSASTNGTLLFVKIPSNQGSKIVVLPVEDVMEIAYSP